MLGSSSPSPTAPHSSPVPSLPGAGRFFSLPPAQDNSPGHPGPFSSSLFCSLVLQEALSLLQGLMQQQQQQLRVWIQQLPRALLLTQPLIIHPLCGQDSSGAASIRLPARVN